jgi:hypothetical protein
MNAASLFLRETPCPVCKGPADLKTDKRGKAYLYCQQYRNGARGIFVCGFHMKYGAHDSAELVRACLGGAPSNENRAPTGTSAPAPASEAKPDRNQIEEGAENGPEPKRFDGGADAEPERAGREPGGFLGCE